MITCDNRLWYQPKNADLVVWCKGIHWDVHRSVLGGMSEWMEKYMPPAAENVSTLGTPLSLTSATLQHGLAAESD